MTVSIDSATAARPPAEVPSSRIRTRAEAETYVASVCFKHGPPRLLGVELEWTVHHADDPRRPLDAETLIRALGPHAPHSLVPDSPQRPLPHGSALTVEPGGQVEVSSLPSPSMRSLLDTVAADAEHVRRRLADAELLLGEHGTDPWRTPHRLLHVPRYAAMECAFDRIGIGGRLMMCSTAGVQVCLDAGEPHRVAPRWAALHALGPVLIAAFANSPELFGEPTGWASARTRSLLRTDIPRMRPGPATADPAADWARRVLDTALLCLRRDGADWGAPGGVTFAEWIGGALPAPPTFDDLDYHLTTMFPPVRPRGYLEVRYLDAQFGDGWMLPAAALIALFHDESTVDEVLELAAPVTGRWVDAARRGLADPVLARTATAVVELACRCLDDLGEAPELVGPLADAVARRLADAR
ncbi:ergothioneine biosynthesis glutamate--cysteine ligase EgtA [Saccharopolyspora gloriosae]|uniref:Glutamate--cysteine ligase EgtA n=1 Tax=Saccharopolyspora gloriosae TaxID=455344 RepID=A0A840NFI2_9PSEU|nr:ergothioneine biosynthesis glutamate--cysteine ligase EgtA [Saccharopolyspora gloriosae]MBB5069731.1 glutamate--cysteine ligase [Saccharopolyspora gloriosae]